MPFVTTKSLCMCCVFGRWICFLLSVSTVWANGCTRSQTENNGHPSDSLSRRRRCHELTLVVRRPAFTSVSNDRSMNKAENLMLSFAA